MGTWPTLIAPASEMVWWGGRSGRIVINAVRSPVRPTTLRIRMVAMASARVIAGRMVVSRRASIDLLAPGGPKRNILGPPETVQRRRGAPHVFVPQGLMGHVTLWVDSDPDEDLQYGSRLVWCYKPRRTA